MIFGNAFLVRYTFLLPPPRPPLIFCVAAPPSSNRYAEALPTHCGAWIKFADLEASLGEDARARAVFELAVAQQALDMPEVGGVGAVHSRSRRRRCRAGTGDLFVKLTHSQVCTRGGGAVIRVRERQRFGKVVRFLKSERTQACAVHVIVCFFLQVLWKRYIEFEIETAKAEREETGDTNDDEDGARGQKVSLRTPPSS